MMLLIAMMLGGATHEDERQQTEHDGLNEADEKLQSEEGHIQHAQDDKP
jgi:hypothetical protein